MDYCFTLVKRDGDDHLLTTLIASFFFADRFWLEAYGISRGKAENAMLAIRNYLSILIEGMTEDDSRILVFRIHDDRLFCNLVAQGPDGSIGSAVNKVGDDLEGQDPGIYHGFE